MMSTPSQEVSLRDPDCTACRIVSGTGLIGIGCYLAFQVPKNTTIAGKVAVSALSLGFISFGVSRCRNKYPFGVKPKWKD